MSKNILYENVDMLNVMEACEDNSKDFIMLFMPTDGRMEQNNYYTDKLNISCEVVRKLTTNGPFIYADNEGIEAGPIMTMLYSTTKNNMAIILRRLAK